MKIEQISFHCPVSILSVLEEMNFLQVERERNKGQSIIQG